MPTGDFKPSFPEVTSWKVRTVRISLIFLMDFFHFNFFSTFYIDDSQNEIIVTLQPHTSDFQNQDSWGNFFKSDNPNDFPYRFFWFDVNLLFLGWGIEWENFHIANSHWWLVKPSFLRELLRKWPSQWFPLWNFVILGYFMACR